MPRVPEYEPNVSLRPNLRQGIDVQASPDAFGAGIGRGMQQAAEGLGNLGASIQRVRELEDEAAVRNARNEYIKKADTLRYDPENGFLLKEGKAALDAYPEYQRQIDQLRKQVASTSKLTPAQQNIFVRTVEPLEADANRQALIHKGGALKNYIINDLKSSVQTFADQAVLNANDPALAQKYIAAGQLELRRQAELQGWGADTLGLQEGEFVSGVHKNITLRIAQSDPLAADAYMKKNSKRLTGADTYALTAALKTEIQSEQSKREADKILSGGRTEHAADPVGDIAPAGTSQAGRTIGSTGPSKARAFLISRAPGKGASAVDNLDESFATNLAAMIQDAPPNIREGLGLYSGYRSVERQRELFGAAVKKYGSVQAARKWVAPPGNSNHNHGRAVDLSYNGQSLSHAPKEVMDWVHQNARKYGMYFPLSNENWHIEPMGTRGTSPVGGGTVAPRNNTVSSRAARPSYDDIEAKLADIADPDVRDLTRKRIYSALEMQSKADTANENAAKAELWKYVDQGSTPDQVPMEVRQAAGMAAVSSAWNYIETASKGRDVESDQTLLYDMTRYAATNPKEFSDLDLNDYRDRLSKQDIKDLTAKQTGALTDERKAREDGLNLTAAFSQADSQLAAVGLTVTDKKGSQREEAAKRIAQFQNALAAQMEEFKRANDNKAPTQVDIQSMVNRLLLPVVIQQEKSIWNPTKTPWSSTFDAPGFAFEAGLRPDGSTVDVVVKYSDIPIDLRRGISLDLERELGRKPSEDEVVQRYEDFSLNRESTPIMDGTPTPYDDLLINRILRPFAAIPGYALIGTASTLGFIDDKMNSAANIAARDREQNLDRFLDGDPLTGGL